MAQDIFIKINGIEGEPQGFKHKEILQMIKPPFMNTIVPYNNFRSGNVILPRHDKTFVVLGAGNSRMGL